MWAAGERNRLREGGVLTDRRRIQLELANPTTRLIVAATITVPNT